MDDKLFSVVNILLQYYFLLHYARVVCNLLFPTQTFKHSSNPQEEEPEEVVLVKLSVIHAWPENTIASPPRNFEARGLRQIHTITYHDLATK